VGYIIGLSVSPAITSVQHLSRAGTVKPISILFLSLPLVIAFPSSFDRIVLLTDISISVETFSEPLQKLKVVLILALDQLLHIDIPLSLDLGEALLKNFEIIDILILIFGLPVNFAQGNIHELTEDGPSSKLLYFGEVGLEEIVDPVEKFPP